MFRNAYKWQDGWIADGGGWGWDLRSLLDEAWEPQKRAAVSLLGGSSPTPGLPGCPVSDQGEGAAYTVQLCAQNQGWRRHWFIGGTSIALVAICRDEAFNQQREELACLEGRLPVVRLRSVWGIFTSWLFPAAALAIPVADLMLINIPGRQKQHALAPARPLGVLAVCQWGEADDTLRYQQDKARWLQAGRKPSSPPRRIGWWQPTIVQNWLSVVWETMLFIISTTVLSGTWTILNETLRKETKIRQC